MISIQVRPVDLYRLSFLLYENGTDSNLDLVESGLGAMAISLCELIYFWFPIPERLQCNCTAAVDG